MGAMGAAPRASPREKPHKENEKKIKIKKIKIRKKKINIFYVVKNCILIWKELIFFYSKLIFGKRQNTKGLFFLISQILSIGKDDPGVRDKWTTISDQGISGWYWN